MFYSVIPALYEEIRIRLTDAVGTAGYFSGLLTFDFGDVACTLRCSLIVCRRSERLPEGTFDRLTDLLPVWWEFHTVLPDGSEPLNDFSFDELRRML